MAGAPARVTRACSLQPGQVDISLGRFSVAHRLAGPRRRACVTRACSLQPSQVDISLGRFSRATFC